MSKLIGRVLVVLLFSWVGWASAAMMPPVQVNGQEWLQPLDFVYNSWNNIAAVCNESTGVCNGSLNGNDLTGWTWAGIPELNALFTAFGIPDFTNNDPTLTVDYEADSAWAPIFLDTFLPTFSDVNEVAGLLRTSFFHTAYGAVANDLYVNELGLVVDGAQTLTNAPLAVNQPRTDAGGWFYRTAVPSPATIPLFGIGLAALGFSRWKRRQQI